MCMSVCLSVYVCVCVHMLCLLVEGIDLLHLIYFIAENQVLFTYSVQWEVRHAHTH